MSSATRWARGRIFTGRRYVESVAAEDGRVVAAGTTRAVRTETATGAETIDLRGRLAVPGLADSHLHLTEIARLAAGVDLHGARSLGEIGRRVREHADRHPEGPVYGDGWDQDRLRERRYPTAHDLDRWLGADRPAVLFRACHHVALLSTAVLADLRIDERTRDPPGGRIGRAPGGSPNGLLFDNALEPLRRWDEANFARGRLGLDTVLRRAASLGLTSLGAVSASPGEVEAVADAARLGALPVRIASFLRAADRATFPALRDRTRTPSTRLVGLKVVGDGAFGARTAWLERPYADQGGERGFPLLSPDELEEIARDADAMDATLAVHAIGDRAVAAALDVFEAVRPVLRPRLEHASLTPPALLERLDRVRPHLVVQPAFVTSDVWIADRLGGRRARWAYAFASFHARGHAPAGSSDAPVESLDPWSGIAAAIRPRRGGVPEAVDAVTALRMYAGNAAPVLGTAGIGSLEPGGLADLVECDGIDLDALARAGASRVRRVWREGLRVDRPPTAGER
ncbi:MAG TPA: amidohydrolase [Thermoplasmata archaeon]|nr:amidohydrolase [Thermoplasmata archaeon]